MEFQGKLGRALASSLQYLWVVGKKLGSVLEIFYTKLLSLKWLEVMRELCRRSAAEFAEHLEAQSFVRQDVSARACKKLTLLRTSAFPTSGLSAVAIFLIAVLGLFVLPSPATADPSTKEILLDIQPTDYEACKGVTEPQRQESWRKLGAEGIGRFALKSMILTEAHEIASDVAERQRMISIGMQECIPIIDDLIKQAESSRLVLEMDSKQGACLPYMAAYNDLAHQIATEYPAYHEAVFFMASPYSRSSEPYRALPKDDPRTYHSGLVQPVMKDFARNLDGTEKVTYDGKKEAIYYRSVYRLRLNAHIENWRADYIREKGVNCFLPENFTFEDRVRKKRDRRCAYHERDWKIFASKKRQELRAFATEDYFNILSELPFLGHVKRQFPGYEGIQNGFARMEKSADSVLDNLEDMEPGGDWDERLRLMAYTPVINQILETKIKEGTYAACSAAYDLREEYNETQTLLHAVLKLDWRTISILGFGAACLLTSYIPLSWVACLGVAGVAEGAVIMYDGQKRYNHWLDRFFIDFDTEIAELQRGIKTSRLTNMEEGRFRTRYKQLTWALFPVLTFGDIVVVKPFIKPSKFVLKLFRPGKEPLSLGVGEQALAGYKAALMAAPIR